MTNNPFITLGVPKDLVVHQYTQGNLRPLQQIAEGYFKVLSKVYHPDRPDGDSDKMALFTEAIEQLRDPDGLEYYVSEMLDTASAARYETKQILRSLELQREATIEALASSLWHINQFDVLGLMEPTSLLVEMGPNRLILDVLSPSRTVLRRPKPTTELPERVDTPRYENGHWTEVYSDGKSVEHYAHTDVVDVGDVRVAGSVRYGRGLDLSGDSTTHVSLENSLKLTAHVDWLMPLQAWYLPHLQGQPIGINEGEVVVTANGRVALLGLIVATAPLQ